MFGFFPFQLIALSYPQAAFERNVAGGTLSGSPIGRMLIRRRSGRRF